MARMKNALMDIYQCAFCNGVGWVFNGEEDEIPCDCNPYDFPKDELEDTFAEWNKYEDSIVIQDREEN